MTASPLFAKCMTLDWQGLCQLYAQLLRESPQNMDLPALALRQKARAGEIPREAIPALLICLVGAEHPMVIAELAKTLAAFGREAAVATSTLIEKTQSFVIDDDPEFWAFDGCLYALGYIAEADDEAAKEYLAQLAATIPEASEASEASDDEDDEYDDYYPEQSTGTPVTRTGDLYKGTMSIEIRDQIFAQTVAAVQKMLAAEDSGAWTSKRTENDPEEKTAKKLPAWLASVS